MSNHPLLDDHSSLETESRKSNLQALRAIHVVHGIEYGAAGPSYSVPRLCAALAHENVATRLLSVGTASDRQTAGYRDMRFVADFAAVPVFRALRASRGMRRALAAEAPASDVIHSHGLWQMPGIYASRAARRAGKPFIVAPRGMLAAPALRFSRRKKAVFSRLFQDTAIHAAACFHATSHQEYEEIRAAGFSAPVAIVPNGIDLPDLAPEMAGDGPRTILALGRIHPKKGLDNLIRAWASLQPRHTDWRLRIVGPSEAGHAEELRALAGEMNIRRLTIEEPLYAEGKAAAYREAELFVLPSMNENFGMTVAEALAAETPVIATRGTPWSGLETEGCGWWIEYGVDPLVSVLDAALFHSPAKLRSMGRRGRAWMAREFEWSAIATSMAEVYEWLARGGPLPVCVQID